MLYSYNHMATVGVKGLYFCTVYLFHTTLTRGGFNGRPLVQWPTGPQANDVMGAPEVA